MSSRPFVMLSAVIVLAQSAGAQSSMAVLSMPASARAAGAGDVAPVAVDASALFYGAQRLPAARTVTASAGTWIGDAQFATVAFATPVGWQRRAGSVVALGVQSLDYGSADEYVPDPATGGTRGTATGGRVGGNELAVSLGFRQARGPRRTGAALTYLRQQVANLSASALTMSVATGVTLGRWDADLSFEHLASGARNPARQTLTIPSQTRLSVLSPAVHTGAAEWRGVAEVRRANRLGTTTVLGAEGTVESAAGWTLAMRGAYLAYTDETARAPWTAGGSAGRGAWALDYAYQGFGALGAVHRMGFTWHSRGPRSPSR